MHVQAASDLFHHPCMVWSLIRRMSIEAHYCCLVFAKHCSLELQQALMLLEAEYVWLFILALEGCVQAPFAS